MKIEMGAARWRLCYRVKFSQSTAQNIFFLLKFASFTSSTLMWFIFGNDIAVAVLFFCHWCTYLLAVFCSNWATYRTLIWQCCKCKQEEEIFCEKGPSQLMTGRGALKRLNQTTWKCTFFTLQKSHIFVFVLFDFFFTLCSRCHSVRKLFPRFPEDDGSEPSSYSRSEVRLFHQTK
jgi:hypothetical protein